VSFSATYADREKDSAEKPVLSRLKEQMFECGSADSYNVCEMGVYRSPRARQARRQHRGAARCGGGHRRSSRSMNKLQTPREPPPTFRWWWQELTGSHYTALQMLESAVGKEHVNIQNGGLPQQHAGRAWQTAATAPWQ